MSKKNTNQAQIIGLKTQKTKTPTIAQKHFANESLEDRLDHLDERVEALAERHELPEAASIDRLGLNDIADAFVPLEKVNGLIEGLGKVEKESVLDELTGSVSFGTAFGVTDGDLKAAAFAGKGMASEGGGNSDEGDGGLSVWDGVCAFLSVGFEVAPSVPTAVGAGLCIARDVLQASENVSDFAEMMREGGGTYGITHTAVKNLWPIHKSDPDDRPGLEDRGGNYNPSAAEVAKAWKELRNWSDPSSTPGVNDEDDTLISNPQAIDQSKIRDKFGKWFSDDYYNNEGSASADKNAAISSKDISINWGDDGAPVVLGSTATVADNNNTAGVESSEPVIAAPEEFF